MPKRIVPLSVFQVNNAKQREKEYKLADGGGLYLLVTPTGGKLWRLKYSWDGKERLLSFGAYPAVNISDARQCRDDAKKLLANGVDPSKARKAQKMARAESAANSFEVLALEWHGKQIQWSDSHREKVLQALKRDVFPWIGSSPISELKAPDILTVLRRIESRGALDTAHRVRTYCGQIFRYAIATSRAERNPAADLVGALPQPEKRHFASIVEPTEIAPLMRMIDGYQGTFVVKCALRLAPLLFVRPGELRQTEWSEVDLERGEIRIPIARMKVSKSEKILHRKQFHYVPLPRQAVEILTELKALTGNSRYVFPGGRSFHRCMSGNAVNAALRRMGIDTKEEICGHGFRAMARTVLEEQLGWDEKFMELQLAHAVKGPLGRAYNRASHLAERRKMLQVWADYLDGLRSGAMVIPFRKAD
ncbi:MAG: integrase [Geobacter sp.]|nr:MAG: integrase [Geobacter sp.]